MREVDGVRRSGQEVLRYSMGQGVRHRILPLKRMEMLEQDCVVKTGFALERWFPCLVLLLEVGNPSGPWARIFDTRW